MARSSSSSSSVRSVLRRFILARSSLQDLSSSSSSRASPAAATVAVYSSFSRQQLSENYPLSSASGDLERPHLFTTFSLSPHPRQRERSPHRDAVVSTLPLFGSRAPSSSSLATGEARIDRIRVNGGTEFEPWDLGLRQDSRFGSSSVMLRPMLFMRSHRAFSSGDTAKDDKKGDVSPTNPPDGSAEDAQNAVHSVKDWAESAYNGIMDSAKSVGDAMDLVIPPIKKFLEDHPVIQDVSIPVGVFTGAWVILPRVLRRMHGYVEQGSAALQLGQERSQTVPYELSMWKAMEDPLRLFATLLTLLQVGVLVAPPSAAVAQYLSQFWSGGSVLCVVWFLHRWKSNVLKRYLSGRKLSKEDKERYLGLDKYSSLGLLFIGALGLAEAAGVAVSSLLTVGGIGGIATAFSAREILANLLTGLTLSFSKPFTVGDTIKAGGLEGKVEEVGLTSTRLLNQEKNPIIVPNAFFTSQAIVNKSRAPWRALAVKIPIRLTDFEKVPMITMEIREILHRNPQVYLEEDKPSCHILQYTTTALEIAIGCNIKPMSKNDYYLVEQDILVEAARIITSCGATLGGQ